MDISKQIICTATETMEESSNADANMRTYILQTFESLHTNTLTTKEIISFIKTYLLPRSGLYEMRLSEAKKLTNRNLYRMDELCKIIDSPPTWKLTHHASHNSAPPEGVSMKKQRKEKVCVFLEASSYSTEQVKNFVETFFREDIDGELLLIYRTANDRDVRAFTTLYKYETVVMYEDATMAERKRKGDLAMFFSNIVCGAIIKNSTRWKDAYVTIYMITPAKISSELIKRTIVILDSVFLDRITIHKPPSPSDALHYIE